MRFSRLTVCFGIWIIISASFMRQLVDLLRQAVGPVYATFFVKTLLLVLGLAVIYFFVLRKELDVRRLAILSILIAAALIYTSRLTIAVEKVHIIEYAVFGWLVCRDLTREGTVLTSVALACFACLVVGSLDEAFQAILPYRVFDWRDIGSNIFGGLEGIAIYLTAEK